MQKFESTFTFLRLPGDTTNKIFVYAKSLYSVGMTGFSTADNGDFTGNNCLASTSKVDHKQVMPSVSATNLNPKQYDRMPIT